MLKLAYKSRRYRQYVEWIAYNDSDADGPNVERIADYLTTTMLAHVNNLTTLRVAKDVAAMRRERDEPDPVEPLHGWWAGDFGTAEVSVPLGEVRNYLN